MRMLIHALIRSYQLAISPWLPRRCRFYPSCSQYALEAIAAHGTVPGVALALRRIACCHPWHAGGYDPVPAAAPTADTSSTLSAYACHAERR